MPKKLTYNYLFEEFKKEGYVLITKNYINNTQRLYYICPVGHKHYITWSNWNNPKKYRCPSCYGNKRYDLNYIIELFNNEEYKLVSRVYRGSNKNLIYICPKGHKGSMTFSNWLRGHRCLKCSYEARRGLNNPNWRGGISYELYDQSWTKLLKKSIKERDGYRCLNPCCNSINYEDLTVHHIDYNKKNCCYNNLITVCRSCNSAANVNRKWYMAWYQAILYRRYSI